MYIIIIRGYLSKFLYINISNVEDTLSNVEVTLSHVGVILRKVVATLSKGRN